MLQNVNGEFIFLLLIKYLSVAFPVELFLCVVVVRCLLNNSIVCQV